MANKKEKTPDEGKKLHNVGDVDELTLGHFYAGRAAGMDECFKIIEKTVRRVLGSLEDTLAIETLGPETPKSKAQAEKYLYGIDSVITMHKMFIEDYVHFLEVHREDEDWDKNEEEELS